MWWFVSRKLRFKKRAVFSEEIYALDRQAP